jgi:hypothetical protein
MPVPTALEIEKQFHTSLDRIYTLSDEYNNDGTPAWKLPQLEQEMNRLISVQKGRSDAYHRQTGHALFAVIPTLVTKSQVQAENNQLLAGQQQALAKHRKQDEKARLKKAADDILTDLNRLRDVCLREIEHTNQNFVMAGLVNTVGGNGMYQPAVTFNNTRVDVEAALTKAASHCDRAQFPLAWAQISIAAVRIQNGFDAHNKWDLARNAGGETTVLAIKVRAAVASLVVTAPYAAAYGSSTVSSWLFNSAIAGTQELAFQS